VDRQAPLIIITGPTCSGKTDLALALAEKFPIEVISADSMQVYRYMDIATAKPTAEERLRLPHHLIDVVNPDEQFQAGMFVRMALCAIREIRGKNRLPLVVGGTGLYIRALVYGLAPAPGRSEKIRQSLRAVIEKKGIGYLEHMLARLDPALSSRIRKNDASRIIRSLEIIFQTGRRPSSIYRGHGFETPLFEARTACIMPDRDLLYRSIDSRVIRMLDQGLVDETRKLLELGYCPELSSMQTLAYKHVVSHLQGSITLDEAAALIQRDTRRFAKRQVTWMKSRPDHVFFSTGEKAFDTVSAWIESSAAGRS
jgi:tRNA dimethylallyltransferase